MTQTRKFKPGDRVTIREHGDRYLAPPGATALVQDPAYRGGYLQLVWDRWPTDYGQNDGGYLDRYFDLFVEPLKAGDEVVLVDDEGFNGARKRGDTGKVDGHSGDLNYLAISWHERSPLNGQMHGTYRANRFRLKNPTPTRHPLEHPTLNYNLNAIVTLAVEAYPDRKISAIKAIRAASGLGLKEAKDAYEAYTVTGRASIDKPGPNTDLTPATPTGDFYLAAMDTWGDGKEINFLVDDNAVPFEVALEHATTRARENAGLRYVVLRAHTEVVTPASPTINTL